MKKTDYVDVFLGTGAIDLPEPKGIARKWHFIKGLAGNTTPAAALPFSKMTACAYSGGYSSGYGHIGVNCGEPLREIMPKGTIRGFSHIHQSGTGFIDTFYNYAVAAPYESGKPEDAFGPEIMENETAHPGYYSATMRGVKCEMTVTRNAALHRWTFPKAGGRIALDFSHDGCLEAKTQVPCRELECSVTAPDTLECSVILHDLKLYFCVSCPGAKAFTWENGGGFECGEMTRVQFALGVSPKNMSIARKGAAEAGLDFDAVAHAAEAEWETALSAIEIDTDDEGEKRLFYSNFYHTLVKPSDWNGESFLYDDDEAFTLDLATLWDQYKTQMPLMFTLYSEISEKIVKTIVSFTLALGRMPHVLLLDMRDWSGEDHQAKMLAEHVLADAYIRGVSFDIQKTVKAIRADVLPEHRFADYKKNGVCDDIAHTVDIADGCAAAAILAHAAGDQELSETLDELAGKWVNAFDANTGLLKECSRFYEGCNRNYSFRLMHDIPTRLKLAGGKQRYAELLDEFFGFTESAGRLPDFEGFNNETDMETPYSYHYADRHDRLSEIISDGMRSMFCEGRGGIPGNNDSGGLSSLYIWNVMGIFPVSGQDLMIIGTPLLNGASMKLANGNCFKINRKGEGIYVDKAVLNGRVLQKLEFSVSEMMRGGELMLYMTDNKI